MIYLHTSVLHLNLQLSEIFTYLCITSVFKTVLTYICRTYLLDFLHRMSLHKSVFLSYLQHIVGQYDYIVMYLLFTSNTILHLILKYSFIIRERYVAALYLKIQL